MVKVGKILSIFFNFAFGINSASSLASSGVGGKQLFRPRTVFQVQPSKTELRVRYATMPGLESSFWHGIRFRTELDGTNFSGPTNLFVFCFYNVAFCPPGVILRGLVAVILRRSSFSIFVSMLYVYIYIFI